MLATKTGGFVPTLDITQGRGDAFPLELNRAVAALGTVVYVRPMPEINGHWNEYSSVRPRRLVAGAALGNRSVQCPVSKR